MAEQNIAKSCIQKAAGVYLIKSALHWSCLDHTLGHEMYKFGCQGVLRISETCACGREP